MNRSKKHVVLELNKQEGRDALLKLLEGADVLLTNVPSGSQQRLGITPELLQRSYPHLVYAHLQAWGNGGPDEHRPGYDLGSFYAATGLAQLFSPEGRFQARDPYKQL